MRVILKVYAIMFSLTAAGIGSGMIATAALNRVGDGMVDQSASLAVPVNQTVGCGNCD